MLVCIIGRTGAGKCVMAKALHDECGLSVARLRTTDAYCSDDYHVVVDEDTAEHEMGDGVAYSNVCGYHYYALPKDVNSSNVLITDLNGLADLKVRMPNLPMVVILMYSDYKVRKKRFLVRSGDESSWLKRDDAEDMQFVNAEYDFMFDGNHNPYAFLGYVDFSNGEHVGISSACERVKRALRAERDLYDSLKCYERII